MSRMKKKGQSLNALAAIGITFVVVAIVLSFGAQILGELQEDTVTGEANCNATSTTACGVEYNISGYGVESVADMGEWLPTIALVVIAAVIIGIVVTFLGRRQ